MIARLKYAFVDSSALTLLVLAIPCLLVASVKLLWLSVELRSQVVSTAIVQAVKERCTLERSNAVVYGINFDKHEFRCDQAQEHKAKHPEIRLTPTYRRTIDVVTHGSNGPARVLSIESGPKYEPHPLLAIGALVTIKYSREREVNHLGRLDARIHHGYNAEMTWIAVLLGLSAALLYLRRALRDLTSRMEGGEIDSKIEQLKEILSRDAEAWRRADAPHLARTSSQ